MYLLKKIVAIYNIHTKIKYYKNVFRYTQNIQIRLWYDFSHNLIGTSFTNVLRFADKLMYSHIILTHVSYIFNMYFKTKYVVVFHMDRSCIIPWIPAFHSQYARVCSPVYKFSSAVKYFFVICVVPISMFKSDSISYDNGMNAQEIGINTPGGVLPNCLKMMLSVCDFVVQMWFYISDNKHSWILKIFRSMTTILADKL